MYYFETDVELRKERQRPPTPRSSSASRGPVPLPREVSTASTSSLGSMLHADDVMHHISFSFLKRESADEIAVKNSFIEDSIYRYLRCKGEPLYENLPVRVKSVILPDIVPEELSEESENEIDIKNGYDFPEKYKVQEENMFSESGSECEDKVVNKGDNKTDFGYDSLKKYKMEEENMFSESKSEESSDEDKSSEINKQDVNEFGHDLLEKYNLQEDKKTSESGDEKEKYKIHHVNPNYYVKNSKPIFHRTQRLSESEGIYGDVSAESSSESDNKIPHVKRNTRRKSEFVQDLIQFDITAEANNFELKTTIETVNKNVCHDLLQKSEESDTKIVENSEVVSVFSHVEKKKSKEGKSKKTRRKSRSKINKISDEEMKVGSTKSKKYKEVEVPEDKEKVPGEVPKVPEKIMEVIPYEMENKERNKNKEKRVIKENTSIAKEKVLNHEKYTIERDVPIEIPTLENQKKDEVKIMSDNAKENKIKSLKYKRNNTSASNTKKEDEKHGSDDDSDKNSEKEDVNHNTETVTSSDNKPEERVSNKDVEMIKPTDNSDTDIDSDNEKNVTKTDEPLPNTKPSVPPRTKIHKTPTPKIPEETKPTPPPVPSRTIKAPELRKKSQAADQLYEELGQVYEPLPPPLPGRNTLIREETSVKSSTLSSTLNRIQQRIPNLKRSLSHTTFLGESSKKFDTLRKFIKKRPKSIFHKQASTDSIPVSQLNKVEGLERPEFGGDLSLEIRHSGVVYEISGDVEWRITLSNGILKWISDDGINSVSLQLVTSMAAGTSANSEPTFEISWTEGACSRNQTFVARVELDRDTWLLKMLEGATSVFPRDLTCGFSRAGWLHVKESSHVPWRPCWVLVRAAAMFYCVQAGNITQCDLSDVSNVDESGREVRLQVKERELLMRAETEGDIRRWAQCLRDAAHEARDITTDDVTDSLSSKHQLDQDAASSLDHESQSSSQDRTPAAGKSEKKVTISSVSGGDTISMISDTSRRDDHVPAQEMSSEHDLDDKQDGGNVGREESSQEGSSSEEDEAGEGRRAVEYASRLPPDQMFISIHVGMFASAITMQVMLGGETTAGDICQDLGRGPGHMLHEYILDGVLSRPLLSTDLVHDVVLCWTRWQPKFCKNNRLVLTPSDFYQDCKVEHKPRMTSSGKLRFADFGSRSYKTFWFELSQGKLKQYKSRKSNVKLQEWIVEDLVWYLGHEPARDPHTTWSITFIDKKNASFRGSYFGATLAGSEHSELAKWGAALFSAARRELP